MLYDENHIKKDWETSKSQFGNVSIKRSPIICKRESALDTRAGVMGMLENPWNLEVEIRGQKDNQLLLAPREANYGSASNWIDLCIAIHWKASISKYWMHYAIPPIDLLSKDILKFLRKECYYTTWDWKMGSFKILGDLMGPMGLSIAIALGGLKGYLRIFWTRRNMPQNK